ncbi:MAG: hypothetical protein PWQ67_811 [Clostridia bacterium]|jgi:hypothetical protein|nr:hypothetical protein [Clostridia bacterium]MDN5322357.1 hypothetical protein [Clostridia bacterium]
MDSDKFKEKILNTLLDMQKKALELRKYKDSVDVEQKKLIIKQLSYLEENISKLNTNLKELERLETEFKTRINNYKLLH